MDGGRVPAMPAIAPELVSALRAARHVVVFTGAGVSAESGIPTFRDALTGLWARLDAADLATPEAFRRHPDLVWGWYEWRRMKALLAQPNPAHWAIARMQHHVPLITLVTQNVDDLHERAGSKAVLHLHGSLHAPRCIDCHTRWICPPGIAREPEGGRRLKPPACSLCGGTIRPGVVWFGESLPEDALEAAFEAAGACDVLLAVGTSGVVHPAALLPGIATQAGAAVAQVNPAPTPLDGSCRWNLKGAAGAMLPALVDTVWPAV